MQQRRQRRGGGSGSGSDSGSGSGSAAAVVRVLLGLAAASVVFVVVFHSESGDLADVRRLELELGRIEARQNIVDRELFALGAELARRNATWRAEAQQALAAAARATDRPTDRPPVPATVVPPTQRTTPDSYFFARDDDLAAACAPRRAAALPASFYEYGPRPAVEACGRAALGLRVEEACPSAATEATPPGRRVRARDLRRQVLVTGVQRSGTHFTWEMFNRLGVHLHHEGLGPAGAVSWFYAWKARSYAINNPDPIRAQRFCVVLHQVRHPLRTISSIVRSTSASDRFWTWLYGVEPALADRRRGPLVALAADLWLRQNERIERYADARFRVEETSPRDVCRAAGFEEFLCSSDGRHHTTSSKVIQPIIEPHAASPAEVDAARKKGKVPTVTWAHLEDADPDLADRVKAMARRYGYDLDPMQHPQSLDTTAFKA